MAKLNFYDTDAVKAFVLDILIENAELKSDLDGSSTLAALKI